MDEARRMECGGMEWRHGVVHGVGHGAWRALSYFSDPSWLPPRVYASCLCPARVYIPSSCLWWRRWWRRREEVVEEEEVVEVVEEEEVVEEVVEEEGGARRWWWWWRRWCRWRRRVDVGWMGWIFF